MAKEFNLAETTMRRLVREDLGLQCFKRRPRMALRAADEDIKYIPKTRSYAYVQCIAVVASNGQKMDLVFLDDKERLCTDTYKAYLDSYVFPWARETFGRSGGGNKMEPAATHLMKRKDG
ncbi:Uncharacterized protein FKW44_013643 [Caligus rogercresseyi]|uniref:Uncharacterized protein n=1 Tax=Caligus rogercresseyi TaxID=217165 RepID=A0A7T8GXT3_CALRO|nr:Uncharacterized protein FKW44_013643 [Caligus rogercresseyi]